MRDGSAYEARDGNANGGPRRRTKRSGANSAIGGRQDNAAASAAQPRSRRCAVRCHTASNGGTRPHVTHCATLRCRQMNKQRAKLAASNSEAAVHRGPTNFHCNLDSSHKMPASTKQTVLRRCSAAATQRKLLPCLRRGTAPRRQHLRRGHDRTSTARSRQKRRQLCVLS
jgi:hypothetical protein